MNDENADQLAEAAKQILDGALPRELVSNYILICETVDEFGNDLQIISNSDASPWLMLGMLKYASGVIAGSALSPDECDDGDFEGDGS